MKTNSRSTIKKLLLKPLTLATGLLFALQFSALAHARLDHAEPAVGSKIKSSPDRVRIWFTDDLDPEHSTIEVKDANGKEVDKKDSRLDSKNKSLLTVSVPKLSPGVYTVNWHVVCEDGHKTQGHFDFTVNH